MGTFVWTPERVIEDACGYADGHAPEVNARYGPHVPGCSGPQTIGSMKIVEGDGRSEPFTLGHEWLHASEGLARDYARVRHLEFVKAR